MRPENFPILSNSTTSAIQTVIQVLNCPIFGTQSSKVIHQLFQQNVQYSSTIIQYPAYAKTPNFNTQISRKSFLLQVKVIQPVFQYSMRPETNLSLLIVDLAQHPIRPPMSILTISTYYCVPYQPTNDRSHNTRDVDNRRF